MSELTSGPGRIFHEAAMRALGEDPAHPPWGISARIARILGVTEPTYARGISAPDSREARARVLEWLDTWNRSGRPRLRYEHGPDAGTFRIVGEETSKDAEGCRG